MRCNNFVVRNWTFCFLSECRARLVHDLTNQQIFDSRCQSSGEDRIVVAPKNWFGPAFVGYSNRDLCPDGWVRLGDS